jgi:hypothetical protein
VTASDARHPGGATGALASDPVASDVDDLVTSGDDDADRAPRGVGAGASPDRWWVRTLLIYAGVLVVLYVVNWQVTVHFVEAVKPSMPFTGSSYLDGWVRYDGGWYNLIADQGYTYFPGRQSTVAFFPAYPLAMRGLGRAIGNIPLAGILVTVACGVGALVAFQQWCRERMRPEAAFTAVLCLMLYPFAYYLYGAVYGDAMFLLAALLAFLAFERGHMVLAGLAGAVATGTRFVGVAVLVGLVVGVLERREVIGRAEGRRRVELRRLRPGDAGVLLAVGGLAGFMAYLWHRFDDPLLFDAVQTTWGQGAGPETWFKIDLLKFVYGEPQLYHTWGLVLQATLCLLTLATVPAVTRRFGWRYGAYVTVLVLIPSIGSQDFQGGGRYLLGAFPTFALVGSALADRPGLRRILLPLSAVVLVVYTGMYANGRYIS